MRTRLFISTLTLFFTLGLTACTPEIGGELWCEMMEEKPKMDWSPNEVADYAEHCVFRK